MQRERIILGIDPGTNMMGYSLILIQGAKLQLIKFGVINLRKLENQALKLRAIFKEVDAIIREYKPDELAIEAPFYGKNVQSMLKLGRAQGVAMAAALNRDIPITEYSPKKVKQSITGKGAASKEQVAAMLRHIVEFNEEPGSLDVTDALAVAVCHHFQGGKQNDGKKYNDWGSFVKNNPERLR